jgi:O-6-methylguanine DNA methyltransferase
MNHQLVTLPALTRDGVFLARYSETGLAELEFPQPNPGKPFKSGIRNSEFGISGGASSRRRLPGKIRQWHRTTTAALKIVLAGRAAKRLPPLDWTGKTEFQQAVWREMLKLGPGETKSYGEIAAAIGKPKAVRAVGGACGANPIPVLVPCHRILAANQQIGGFSGGIERKRAMLKREGIEI